LSWSSGCYGCFLPTGVLAQDKQPIASIALQLEVSINGQKIGLIGSFVLLDNQRIAATRDELENLGLVAPAGYHGVPVPLDAIAGLTYHYDAASQSINIVASDANLRAHEIGPSIGSATPKPDHTLVGAVVNYGLRGSLYGDSLLLSGLQPGPSQSVSIDSRLFGPMGTLSNSGFLDTKTVGYSQAVRLDSTWSWSDPDTLRTWSLGDVVTRGPAWSRPIRLGGAQVQTNFGLRPDLVTAPQPVFRGSTAVPSTVDVYINNVETYSQAVQPGPFVVSNLPAVNGPGSARVVVRDATGGETVQTSYFYTTPTLLRAGLLDYSVEAGFVRGNYGIISDDYDANPVVSVSGRYGLTNTVTLESHGEFGAGLANAGFGTEFSLFDNSLLSFAASASTLAGTSGAQIYAALETKIGPASLHLSSQRTLGPYEDLAGVIRPTALPTSLTVPDLNVTSLEPPKALDLAMISLPLAGAAGDLSVGVINRTTDTLSSLIVSGSYSRSVFGNAALYVSGFHDLKTDDTGIFAGVTVSMGADEHTQIGVSNNAGLTEVSTEYAKTASREAGSLGWRIDDSEGNLPNRSAAVTYQGTSARFEGGIDQLGNQIDGWATAEGAIVATNKGVFLSNRIDDAFAVVDVGVPSVDVFLENRKVATTDGDGHALVPGLRSYQSNKISIDPTTLPPDAVTPDVTTLAVPGDRNGVAVALRSSIVVSGAVVVFRDQAGTFLPAGAQGTLSSTGQPFVVGYDGRAFIEGLDAQNTAIINVGGQGCTASFAFKARQGTQVVIEGVTCK